MKLIKIPRRIDEPPHLLLWSSDELAPILVGLTVGVIIAKALICTLVGVVVTNAYKKFRDNHPDGYFLHLLYWFGLIIFKNKSFKNPYVRRYLP